jgi:hypothetical protein
MNITDAQAEELYRYMRNQYLDPNSWPALRQLLVEVDEHLDIRGRTLRQVSSTTLAYVPMPELKMSGAE